MFKKILIANRGEIALRVLRACRELGIETVVVYSQADADSLAVKFADEAVCIGAASSAESYLNIPRIVSAAEIANVDAVHPGYGFLAESPAFAEVLASCNLTLIGPTAETMRIMGDKALARETMRAAGVPVIPGSPGPVSEVRIACSVADEIGYPVLIKAVAGGGGRGMRVVHGEADMERAFSAAHREAESAFGDGRLYLEHYIDHPRHIEFQVAGDGVQCVHFGERECSIQRRHQKLIEESPSTAVTPGLRDEMGAVAVRGALAVDYLGLGTMEFLLDSAGSYFFIEMNTRIQVEHPVTELVCDIDLVKLQIRLAAGDRLPLSKNDVHLRGHALECRINAEDPDNSFAPCPGVIGAFHQPGGPGIRIDTHLYAGYTVSPNYDSLLAKVIAYGTDREEARVRMVRTLEEMVIEGVKTTIPFHLRVLADERFRSGSLHTGFIDGMVV
ncbi:acetyl-CoA carboxylase biotin carboxylase subunit [Candidatus Fermentibacteria bacterium]|nr:acetyl-CoA carboxylase biotin carboxylase subunit [Candidatus Fermentibacteria bacterium]